MDHNIILKQLLTEYEQTRMKNTRDLEKRKELIYLKLPRLAQIEKEINLISIAIAKNSLSSSPKDSSYEKEEIEKLKLERQKLLTDNNFKLSDLFLKYNCNICKDTGYVFHNLQTEMCKCLKQKLLDIQYNNSNINNLNNDTFNNLNLNLYSDNVDYNKYHEDLSPRDNIKNIKDACLDFVKNFNDLDGKNLLFSGSTGLGKTYLSNAIVSEIIKQGYTVLYQTAPVMLDTLISKLFKNDTSFSENLLNVNLLVIDDLGTETINSMKFTELYKIINTRLLNTGKITKTIISTNLDLQGLYNTYDERLVSRFVGYYDIYKFFGDDIRFKK